MNCVPPKAAAKHDLLFNKLASDFIKHIFLKIYYE
jgi:hypothetical protein